MEEIQTYTLEEAHEYFARSINGRVWQLLQMPDRSQFDNDEMLSAAHACTFHWKFVGTAVHQQRGEWLISHVQAVLGHGNEALRHAERCFALTESNREIMKDFDIAYAFEGLARAHAMVGDQKMAEEFFELARAAGSTIMDEEDRSIFMGDFESGEWYGLR
ncbi:MAG TPA: hypothetical protein VK206_02865 [Anaerolineales bacterium]|nr:hypothetical protein [Anaerolineales bacterium]HLO27860.1 hypothetical protein [Anaerolineales bacterium]